VGLHLFIGLDYDLDHPGFIYPEKPAIPSGGEQEPAQGSAAGAGSLSGDLRAAFDYDSDSLAGQI